MAIASYADLLDELSAWLNRSDLTARIPTFIRLFEARMNRSLRIPEMEANTTFTTAAALTDYTLPADFLEARELTVLGNADVLIEAGSAQDIRYRIAALYAGTTQFYAVQGGNLVIAPAPLAGAMLNLRYYQRIPALSATNTTNWLLNAHPDAYLFGVLCMAEAYIYDDNRLAVWKNAWDEVMAEIASSANRHRLPAAPVAMRSPVFE